MRNQTKAQDLPAEEKVYMTKDIFGWRIVHPIKNDDGTTNLVNLLVGGWRNCAISIIVIVMILFLAWSYNKDINTIQANCVNINADPIGWCEEICDLKDTNTTRNLTNLTNLNFVTS